ncbi:hypothetical protein LOK49_LG10G01701 [Camellia lanceoleosa]|uniref:Uncharacterized protein n=1 Tax=Camellia lanceoleosa TaxID=1840588 RepID=A0ACC0GGX8_9ERIC|nr:hypothetical protein LOK49_LG10G01701 [Camellia lanceoleosa]
MDNMIEIWPRELQAEVRYMNIWMCRKLSNILFPSNVIKGMQSLELLSVERCQSVEVAFDLEGIIVREGYPDIILPSLTKLVLRYLPKLTHVWKSNLLRIPSFQNLTSLTVVGCSSLRYIFSSSQARLLVKLQQIIVAACGVLEAIVNEEPKVDDEVATNIIMFPQLNSLRLYHLPNLKSLCPQAYTFEGSFFEEIKVINCPNMRALPSSLQRMLEPQERNVREVKFFNSAQHHLLDRKFSLSTKGTLDVTGIDEPTEIWHNQLEVGRLDKVRFMRVQCCGKLSSVVSSKLMQRLHNIQGLKVWWCDSLEMIFDLQEGVCADVAEKETLITQLSELKLKYLPELTHIWNNILQQTHCFQNLSSLRVQHCDNLRYIFTISVANALVNLEYLTVQHCMKVEKIVTRENEEEIFSREIHSVYLANLPSLVCFGPDVNDTKIPAKIIKARLCPKFPGDFQGIIFSNSMKIKKLEKPTKSYTDESSLGWEIESMSQTSFGSATKTKHGEVERKKGTPWTEEEHRYIFWNYFDLEQYPFISELTHRFQGFRERLLADPKFLHKLAIEEAISITTTLLAQYERHKDNFFEEIDYVIMDTVGGSVVDFFTIWLPAPTLSFLSIGDTIDTPDNMEALKGLLGSIPDNAFQRNIAGKDWNVNHRVASVLFGGLKLADVGFVSSIGTVVTSNILYAIRKLLNPALDTKQLIKRSPILKTTVVYGGFLGTSSNLRYQVEQVALATIIFFSLKPFLISIFYFLFSQ